MEQQITNQTSLVAMCDSIKSSLKMQMAGKVMTICLFASWMLISNNMLAQKSNQTNQSKAGSFVLTGTIENAENPYLYLLYEITPGVRGIDSSKIIDGKFRFKGSIPEPTWALLRENPKTIDDDKNLNMAIIYLEKGIITAQLVHNDFQSIRLSGSKTQEENVKYDNLMTPFRGQYAALRNQLEKVGKKKTSKEQLDSLKRLSEDAIRGMRSTTFQFIYDNPNSYVSGKELSSLRNRWPLDTVKYLFDNFSPEIKKSFNGREIADLIKAKEAAAVGVMAHDFSGLEFGGKEIKLSDFRGKFVLVDFWGSWCAPCREGNPHLIEIYDRYKDRGFEIVGVASHDKEAPWRKAVKKDKIGIWKNIIDTDTESSGRAIAHKYGVFSYPTKFLIDKNGIIIGRFSGDDGNKLDALLAERLK